jgi:hypothetical protein
MTFCQHIYVLSAPHEPDLIRYIGRTNDIGIRMRAHEDWQLDCNPRSVWLTYLKSSGQTPLVKVLEEYRTDGEKEAEVWAKERESYWIRHTFDGGGDLVNGNVFWKHPSRVEVPLGVRNAWCVLHETIARIDFDLQFRHEGDFHEITRYRVLVAIKSLRDEFPGLRIAPLEWLGEVFGSGDAKCDDRNGERN